ncbi:hypothetical protein F444_10973 [Phytophthora nicotianae P1976]|uniref:Uncharacterized protein n=1 Tax=Phytophthora nicotianae P1976 TaxID=1317066 RepID=A0A081A2F5_PHYNI|nr:hypothetical protein F444_10973 [Phytophthora nicotianae P1976]
MAFYRDEHFTDTKIWSSKNWSNGVQISTHLAKNSTSSYGGSDVRRQVMKFDFADAHAVNHDGARSQLDETLLASRKRPKIKLLLPAPVRATMPTFLSWSRSTRIRLGR